MMLPPDRSTPLAHEIRRAAERAGGRIPFRDYMALALFLPAYGYYSTSGARVGKRGDYVTSPHVSRLFGLALANFLEEVFAGGLPRQVVELGAGDGRLADVLCAQVAYSMVERSPSQRQRLQARLGQRAALISAIPNGFEGVILSNELLDALPVHRLVTNQERYVTATLQEELGPWSDPRLDAHFERLGLQPAGQAEVNLDGTTLMTDVYARLKRGTVLTIDYGYEANELYVGHPQGTFLSYYQHTIVDDPYRHVGQQDMTAHVDFTTLQLLGQQAGVEAAWFTTQADFLVRYGIGELILAEQTRADSSAAFAAIGAAAASLLHPAGLGGFRVLVQTKR